MPLCPTPPLVKTECINCNGINFWSYYTSRVVLLESPVARILAPCLPMLLKERSRLVSAVSLDRTCPITWQLNQTWSNTQWIQVGHHDIKLLQCKKSTGTVLLMVRYKLHPPPLTESWDRSETGQGASPWRMCERRMSPAVWPSCHPTVQGRKIIASSTEYESNS